VDNEEIEGNDEGLRDLMQATKLGVKSLFGCRITQVFEKPDYLI